LVPIPDPIYGSENSGKVSATKKIKKFQLNFRGYAIQRYVEGLASVFFFDLLLFAALAAKEVSAPSQRSWLNQGD
jgi:hypothetical protein